MHAVGPLRQDDVVAGRTEAGQPRRIEVADESLEVGGRLRGPHVAADGGQRHDLDPGIEQGEGDGHGVVDPGIHVDDQLAGRDGGHGAALERVRVV